ncbi:MAG: hypothetical protein VX899_17235 [Myxococcota bacterium]|nr:hypothetical protein [Myxococcota bacterium]
MADLRVLVVDEALAAKALKALGAAEIAVQAQGKVAQDQDPVRAAVSILGELRAARTPAAPAQEGLQVQPMAAEEAPETPLPSWQIALAERGGVLQRDKRVGPPPALASSAPIMDVLNSAGEVGVVQLGDERYAAYGWPDLRRENAKVLLVGPGEPLGEIVALHRLPAKVGLCRRGGGLLHSTGRMGRTSTEVTGSDYPGDGRLFAVDSDAIWVLDGQQVSRWDGHRVQPQGAPSSALASLMLTWSQR